MGVVATDKFHIASGALINRRVFDGSLVTISDIAGALSRLCRYGGHLRCSGVEGAEPFFSVGEHSLHVAAAIRREHPDAPAAWEAWGLFHDASEAFIGDSPRPVKSLMPEYCKLEDSILQSIGDAFGLPWPVPPVVGEIDHRMIAVEGPVFLPHADWTPSGMPPAGVVVPDPRFVVGVTLQDGATEFFTSYPRLVRAAFEREAVRLLDLVAAEAENAR